MAGPEAPVEGLTLTEWQRLASAAVRRYLDAASGQKPLASLLPWLSPAVRGAVKLPDQNSPPVRFADIGPVAVIPTGPNNVHAVVAVRVEGVWSVVALEIVTDDDGHVWIQRMGELEQRNLARLADRQPAVGPGQHTPDPPPVLTEILGPLPESPTHQTVWATAAAVIHTYRERHRLWGSAGLGPMPSDPTQRAERKRTEAVLRRLTAQLG